MLKVEYLLIPRKAPHCHCLALRIPRSAVLDEEEERSGSSMDVNALFHLLWAEGYPGADRLLKQCSDEDSRRNTTWRSERGRTVLHECAHKGAPASTVRAILRASPQGIINAQGEDGATAAMWAASWGRARVLAQLMKAGADMGLRTVEGATTRLRSRCSLTTRSSPSICASIATTRSTRYSASTSP